METEGSRGTSKNSRESEGGEEKAGAVTEQTAAIEAEDTWRNKKKEDGGATEERGRKEWKDKANSGNEEDEGFEGRGEAERETVANLRQNGEQPEETPGVS